MTPQLIAVDANALERIEAQIAELSAKVEAARFQPEPKWLTVREYAARVGKSESTVNRWIARGEIEAETVGKSRMVRV